MCVRKKEAESVCVCMCVYVCVCVCVYVCLCLCLCLCVIETPLAGLLALSDVVTQSVAAKLLFCVAATSMSQVY